MLEDPERALPLAEIPPNPPIPRWLPPSDPHPSNPRYVLPTTPPLFTIGSTISFGQQADVAPSNGNHSRYFVVSPGSAGADRNERTIKDDSDDQGQSPLPPAG